MPKDFLALDTNFPSFTGTETTDQKVDQLYNYTYMLLENLRYTLRNLDGSNFNEEGLNDITDPIYRKIENAEGNITELAIEATGLALRVSNAEGDIAQLGITAQGLAAQISSAEGDITSLQATAQGLAAQISNAEGDITSLQATAAGLSAQITNAEGDIASLQITAGGLQTQIGSVSGEVTTLQQTVDSFTISASNGETSSTLRLMAGGVTLSSAVIKFSGVVLFEDLDGSSGTIINGGAIATDTLFLDSLYGNIIYLYDKYEDSGARFEITGASSYKGGALNILSGAIGIYALGGDLFLSSETGYVTLSGTDATCQSDFYPSSDDRYDLGTPNFVWSNVYASSGVVNTSDREKKESIIYGLYKLDGLLDKLEPCTCKFKNGTSGRTHATFVAQDVETALGELGLTSMDFAGLIKSPRKDSEGKETGEYDYGLRYTEFIPINTWEIKKLKTRVNELEKRLAALEGGNNG